MVQRRTGNNPVVVHCRSVKWVANEICVCFTSLDLSVCLSLFLCSDTVSRSGMFCAIATVIDRLKTEAVVDVFQVVKSQRKQKPGMVPKVVSAVCMRERERATCSHHLSSSKIYVYNISQSVCFSFFFLHRNSTSLYMMLLWHFLTPLRYTPISVNANALLDRK